MESRPHGGVPFLWAEVCRTAGSGPKMAAKIGQKIKIFKFLQNCSDQDENLIGVFRMSKNISWDHLGPLEKAL